MKVTVIFPGAIGTNIAQNSGLDQRAMEQNSEAEAPPIKPLPASKASEIIIDGIEKDSYRILVGSDARLMDFLYRLAPKFTVEQHRRLRIALDILHLLCDGLCAQQQLAVAVFILDGNGVDAAICVVCTEPRQQRLRQKRSQLSLRKTRNLRIAFHFFHHFPFSQAMRHISCLTVSEATSYFLDMQIPNFWIELLKG